MAQWVQLQNKRTKDHYAVAVLGVYDTPEGDVETVYGICHFEVAYPPNYRTPYVWQVVTALGDPLSLEASVIALNETGSITESHAAAEATAAEWLAGDRVKPNPLEWD